MTDDIPILMCGDMNSNPDSSCFAFMDGKAIVPYHRVVKKNKKHLHLYDVISEDVKTKNLVLQGKFTSSYSMFPHKSMFFKTEYK